MVNALIAFGLAIGWMDIVGVLCFEMVMFYMMRRRRLSKTEDLSTLEEQTVDQKPRNSLPSKSCIYLIIKYCFKKKPKPLLDLLSRQRMVESENAWIFWGYLLMLNVWIVVSLLMIAGITMHKPELMTIYLTWCFCGLVIDVLMILWWIFELFVGDAIVAMTNILISLLTFGKVLDYISRSKFIISFSAVELAFVLIIYAIYLNLAWSPDAENTKITSYFHWLLLEN
ncbi:hypothetical protein KR032_008753 [Drosophila birchii]|nr:hypothetical protein KR032_008753 [Drosophila birchii]